MSNCSACTHYGSNPEDCTCKRGGAEPIGWMFHTGKGFAVKCTGCACKGLPENVPATKEAFAAIGYTPIFKVNIEPYKQTCFDCTVTLVDGRWCELFTGE